MKKGDKKRTNRNHKFDEILGSFLRTKRQEKNLSLSELNDVAGLNLNKSSLSIIESGKQQLTSYQLFLISKALNFSVDDFFNLIDLNEINIQKDLKILGDSIIDIKEL